MAEPGPDQAASASTTEVSCSAMVRRVLREGGRASLRDVAHLLLEPDVDTRVRALALLAARRAPEAIPIVTPIAQHETRDVLVAHALRALAGAATSDDAGALGPLAAARDDDAPPVARARHALSLALARAPGPLPRVVPDDDAAARRRALVAVLEHDPLPDEGLLAALAEARGAGRLELLAALGTLKHEELARAVGGALVVLDDDGRGLLCDVLRRVASALPRDERAALARLMIQAMADAGTATADALDLALVAVDEEQAIARLLVAPAGASPRAIAALSHVAAQALDDTHPGPSRQLDAARVAAALDVRPALALALLAFVPLDDVDPDVVARLDAAAARAARPEVLDAVDGADVLALAAYLARRPLRHGAFPVALGQRLLAAETRAATIAVLALARAHPDEEGAQALVDVLASATGDVRRLAERAVTRFASRVVRIDRGTIPPTVVADHRGADGELLTVDGPFLIDHRGHRYARGEAGTPVPVGAAPFGPCACCPRARVLVASSTGIVCPVTGERYVVEGGAAVPAGAHPRGACARCAGAAPLVEKGADLVCPTCGAVRGAPSPSPSSSSSPSDVPLALGRADLGIPPAPRLRELDALKPVPRRVLVAHVFVTSELARVGNGVLIAQRDDGVVTALIALDPEVLEELEGEPLFVYTVSGERALAHRRAIDRERGVVVVELLLRRPERVGITSAIAHAPPKSGALLVAGGGRRGAWEVGAARITRDATLPPFAPWRVRPRAHLVGTAFTDVQGALVGLAYGDGGALMPLVEIHRRFAEEDAAVGALLAPTTDVDG